MWFKWALIVLLFARVAGEFGQVGKQRKPVTSSHALLVFVMSALVATGILYYWP